jgi:hypothetical protein
MSSWFRAGLGLLLACAAVTEAQENAAALNFRKGTEFRKTTLQECTRQGGEFVGAPGLKPEDLVDCLLPHKVRGLGAPAGAPGAAAAPREVLASVYDYLYRPSIERPGYALYSYLLLPNETARGERLLQEVFSTTSFVGLDGVRLDRLNVIYIPTRADQVQRLLPAVAAGDAPPAAGFSRRSYDYTLARTLLARICATVTEKTRSACAGDRSPGPYIFTFLQPVTGLAEVPAPFLLLDLGNVHERAFGEFVAAYKEQVRQPQFSDRQRIDTFRLRILSVVLTSADWLKPLVGQDTGVATLVE